MVSIEVSQPLVFQIQECLDAKAGSHIEKEVAAIAPGRPMLVLIDMSQVDFVDSSGLFTLVSVLRSAREKGVRLVLCNLKATVRLIFEISQLDRVFEIYENTEAVLKTLVSESSQADPMAA